MINKGFASEYTNDGQAIGGGKLMKDDPRVIIFDDFSDYGGDLAKYAKEGYDKSVKRWICSMDRGMYLDDAEKYTGNCSLKIPVPQQNEPYGGTICQWVDKRALRGEPTNDEIMSAKGFNVKGIPEGGMPVDGNVRPREGGFDRMYARMMVKYAKGYDRYGHSGIEMTGGYFSRPNPGHGGGENNPGSTAGYRSNGFDRFCIGLEPVYTHNLDIPRPGSLSAYFYGAEQMGATGNHMYSNGLVFGSTGGDDDFTLSRKDGVNGFKALPLCVLPVGDWLCLELYVKLNTVIKNGASPGPNEMPIFSKTRGPQPKPADCEILHDGEIKAWMNGKLVMDFTDVVVRYTDTLVIDEVRFCSYFGDNRGAPTALWYDNIVVATEYIGPVNKG